MTDREQIIKEFEHAVNKVHGEDYAYVTLTVEYANKILELLKGQKDMVVCKDCQHYVASRGTCSKGHAHGYAETWFCADGE